MTIEATTLSRVPSEVLSLTRPGVGSAMKQWVSEVRTGDADGLAWLAWEEGMDPLGPSRLVGWVAVMDGEMSIYVRPSERRRGIGSLLMGAVGDASNLVVRPHNRIGEMFFERHGISF